MAKKVENPASAMVERFAEFKELKNIDKTTMITVLEESFRRVLQGMFGTDSNLDVIMNPDKGDVEIFQNLEVVEDGTVTNPNLQISISDARAAGDPDVEIGEEHTKKIYFEKFGRRALLTLRQTLQSKVLELQKAAQIAKFNELKGEIVTGEVYQAWSRETLLFDEDKCEMTLPKQQSIPGEYFRKGEIVRALVTQVTDDKDNLKVLLSRTSDDFLRRLFEMEVPEIHDGLINIRAVARIPGQRAKIAVESYDDRVDPVGACVGVRGSRIHGIVRELHNENIDVLNYTDNAQLFIQRALAPARINYIAVDEEKKKAEVFLSKEEVTFAIGRDGLNIRLASMLTGYQIDVYRDEKNTFDKDDIYLEQFDNEIEGWMLDSLKKAGMFTAKDVLRTPRLDIADRADLEEEQVDEILEVLRAEYDDDELRAIPDATLYPELANGAQTEAEADVDEATDEPGLEPEPRHATEAETEAEARAVADDEPQPGDDQPAR